MVTTPQKVLPQLRFPEFDGEWKFSPLKKEAIINPKTNNLPKKFIYIDLESVTKGNLVKEDEIYIEDAPSRAQRVLEIEDILFQTVRPYQKNNYFFNKGGNYVASTGYAQIKAKGDSQYLFQFLHTTPFVNVVNRWSTGTSYPAISPSELSKISVAFPSLPEQQKIASFLSAVDQKIQQLTKKKELLEQYKKGVMQQLFSQKLRFKKEDGTSYPDWEEKRLEQLSLRIGDGIHSTPKYDDEGNYHFVNGNNLTNGKILINETTKRVNEEEYLKHKRELGNRTILLSINGTIGNIAFYNNERIVLGKSACYINIDESVNLNYIYLIIQSQSIINYFISELTGSTIKNLSLKTIRHTSIKLPCIEEQQKIASYLTAIDTKIENVTHQITQTQRFKKGLLQQMFV